MLIPSVLIVSLLHLFFGANAAPSSKSLTTHGTSGLNKISRDHDYPSTVRAAQDWNDPELEKIEAKLEDIGSGREGFGEDLINGGKDEHSADWQLVGTGP